MKKAASVKKSLRKTFLEARSNIGASYRAKADIAICDLLSRVDELDGRGLIAAYVSDGTEPSLEKFSRCAMELRGARMCFPRFKDGEYEMALVTSCDIDFTKGKYGLLEPRPHLPAVDLDREENMTWLVPGVAFDLSGGRLGRGKSVYDKFLKGRDGFKIGVFYECQKCDSIPMEDHDCKMDMLVTEMGVRRVAERSGSSL